MQSTCSANDRDNARRRQRRAENRLQRDLCLERKIQANRRKYPKLFQIIDSSGFRNWYYDAIGREFDMRQAANIEQLVVTLHSMQVVYGEIPD